MKSITDKLNSYYTGNCGIVTITSHESAGSFSVRVYLKNMLLNNDEYVLGVNTVELYRLETPSKFKAVLVVEELKLLINELIENFDGLEIGYNKLLID